MPVPDVSVGLLSPGTRDCVVPGQEQPLRASRDLRRIPETWLIAPAADPSDEEDAGPGEAGTLLAAAEVTGVDVFAAIRDEPGNVSVKTTGQETFKLGAIRAVGLPDDLLADVAPKVLAGWRARVPVRLVRSKNWPPGDAHSMSGAWKKGTG